MNKRILIFAAAAVMAGIASFAVVQKFGQPAAVPAAQSPPVPPTSPADILALTAKAESGDEVAQTALGWIYQKGDGVKPDMKTAAKWLRQAADQNYPDALAALGEMTQAGQGVPLDLAEAARLYRLAAEKGNVAGQYNLAYLYEQGSGVEKNETNAARWYQLAAEGGDPIAQYDIGQRYLLGVGVASNRVEAFKWLTLAAGQGQADSSRLQKNLKSEMTAGELGQADQLVRTFAPRLLNVLDQTNK